MLVASLQIGKPQLNRGLKTILVKNKVKYWVTMDIRMEQHKFN